MTLLRLKVVRKDCEAEDICGYELAALDGAALPAFSAGAHIDVHVRPGLVRQYSLCNAPGERHRYQIGVLRDPASRGGSVAMHEEIEIGTVLEVSEPKNHFPLVDAKRSLLFAGGIGVTPMLAMAEALAAADASFALHYCTRAPERTAFHARLAGSPFAGQVHHHYDSGAAEQKLALETLLATPEADTHIYVCGPGGFIDYVCSTAAAKGWPSAQVHREYFGAAPVDSSGDGSFAVKLASSGKSIEIPAGRSVAAVLADHGVFIPVSCEQGVCGTCLTRVLDGVPDHRDVYLTDEEHAANDQFTPCCSRAKSTTLLLDV